MARLTHTWLIDPTKRDIHPDKPPPEPSNLRRQCAPSFGPVPTDLRAPNRRSLSVALRFAAGPSLGRVGIGQDAHRHRGPSAGVRVGSASLRRVALHDVRERLQKLHSTDAVHCVCAKGA